MAFLSHPLSSAPTMRVSRRRVTCALNDGRHSRREALAAAVAAAAAFVPISAKAGGGVGLERAVSKFFFPKEGFNVPDAPLAGSIDKKLLETGSGKEAIESLRKYQSAVDELYAEFKADPQTKLSPRVASAFKISELREVLNTFTEAFDENSQRETDKVVRNIIQDVGELQTAAALREGTTRTQKKIDRTTDWFEKLVTDFKRLMAFYV